MTSTATRPALPGVYPTYSAERRTVVPPNPGAVVGLPIVTNWGPIGDSEAYISLALYENDFGTDDTPGHRAVQDAFTGIGLDGQGGAGAVIVSRLAGSAAAQSTVTVKNPADGDAFTFKGKFKGTRADALDVTVTPVTTGVQEIIVLDNTVEIESYTYRIADAGALAGLKTQIDKQSDLLTGLVVLEGITGLKPGTYSLAGGNDGTTLTGTDWLNGVSVYQDWNFAYLAPYDLPWAQGVGAQSIRDTINSIVAWRDQQEDEGHRFELVFGNALDALPADTIAMAESLLHPNVLVVGGPGFNDDVNGARSGSQMAPRIAGIRAFRGESGSMDMARVAGGVPRPLPTGSRLPLTSVIDMVQAGAIVLRRDRYAAAPTCIAADVNTYQPDVDDPDNEPADRPRTIWGNPKFVLSMDQFANDAQQEIELEMIGRVIVNDATRNAAAARVLRMAKERERRGAFAAGTIVEAVPGADTDNFIVVKVTLTFGRALTQLFIQGTVR